MYFIVLANKKSATYRLLTPGIPDEISADPVSHICETSVGFFPIV